MAQYLDEITGQIVELEFEPTDLGYRTNRTPSLSEWYGAQDPAYLEKKKMNDDDHYKNPDHYDFITRGR